MVEYMGVSSQEFKQINIPLPLYKILRNKVDYSHYLETDYKHVAESLMDIMRILFPFMPECIDKPTPSFSQQKELLYSHVEQHYDDTAKLDQLKETINQNPNADERKELQSIIESIF